ncbi:MAG: hypothetical protein OXN86_13425 [Chloroflexota bacterium]|nr:hypothetical protein [Chloroflexota bacterium]
MEGRLRDLAGTQAPDEERARRAILRSMLIWTPAFGLLTVGAVYMMVEALGGNGGSWFGFSLFALIGLLSGFSALSAFRDWFSEPIETTGQVARKWRKFDLLIFFRAHYVLVARRVYRVPRLVFDEMPEPGGWIYLNHYPHTNALVAWRPLGDDERPRSEEEAAEEAEQDAATVDDAWEQRRQEREQEAAAARERVELPSFGDRRDE